MTEPVYPLPDIFFSGIPAEINIHFYYTGRTTAYNRVCLNQNLICILSEGEKEVLTGLNHGMLRAGELMLLQTGNSLMSEKTGGSKTLRSILLFFSDAFLADLAGRYGIAVKTADTGSGLVIFSENDYISNFEQSLRLLEKRTLQHSIIKSKCEEILLYLFDCYPAEMSGFLKQRLGNSRHTRLMQIINNQQNYNLSNEELAFLCHMSVSSFKRHFTEVFKTSPKQYFIARKMDRAIAMLKQNMRPSEIYAELGYENLSAFSNEFKKHFGSSPTQYSFHN